VWTTTRGRLQEGAAERHPTLDLAGVLSTEVDAHHAWMDRVGGDRNGCQSPSQLIGKPDIGELWLAIGPST